MKTGIELIADERKEQIEKHGWTLEHDIKEHEGCDLSYNAAVLASPEILFYKEDFANSISFKVANAYEGWKLPELAYKKDSNVRVGNENLSKEKRIKQLIVAGALLAAEIDRLQN